MLIPLTCTFVYEMLQFRSDPREYFKKTSNVLDSLNSFFGYANLYFQYYYNGRYVHHKIIFIIMVFCSTQKLVSLMRISPRFSYIVVLFEHVLRELMVYMLFFVMIVFMVSQMLAITDCDMDI